MVLPISFFLTGIIKPMLAPTPFVCDMQNNIHNNIDESSFGATLRSTFPTD